MTTNFVAMILKKPNFSGWLNVSQQASLNPDSYEQFTLRARDFEHVFQQLNADTRPEGYKGRSLSVGDMIYDDSNGVIVMVTPNGFVNLD